MAYTRKLGAMAKYTSYVTLPKEHVSSLGWRHGQKVKVDKRGGAIVIRDARTRKKR